MDLGGSIIEPLVIAFLLIIPIRQHVHPFLFIIHTVLCMCGLYPWAVLMILFMNYVTPPTIKRENIVRDTVTIYRSIMMTMTVAAILAVGESILANIQYFQISKYSHDDLQK